MKICEQAALATGNKFECDTACHCGCTVRYSCYPYECIECKSNRGKTPEQKDREIVNQRKRRGFKKTAESFTEFCNNRDINKGN